jgi:hypothetical protein
LHEADDVKQANSNGVDYWVQSQRPLASLVFIAPLLATYELGVLLLGPSAIRNGADVWLRQVLELIGFGQYFLLPAVCVCILLGWHHTTRQPWEVAPSVLKGMVCECVLLAIGLRFLLHLQSGLFDPSAAPPPAALLAADAHETARRLVGFLGAGVYEELLFRLILLSSVVWVLRSLDMAPGASVFTAALSTSLFFALAHYIGPHAEALDWQSHWFWFTFVFRFLAGMFFSLLFVIRGFGIAAGAHAGYDILVGIW